MAEPTVGAPPVQEYVSDVPYPRNFVAQLAPAAVRLAAALSGYATPDRDRFDYCELGAGRGDTLVTLAAANPEARFLGVDLGRDHVAFAEGLATGAGLSNVRLTEADFEDTALASDAGDFDYVVAHGVLSWVSPAKRDALFRFASARLKPGGVLLVSYNALPGWAAIEPLRRAMLDHAARTPGSTLERARAAYDFVRRLEGAKAGYFASHPTAVRMLELMKEGGVEYVVHEYFHAHWHPMHVGDVAAEAGARDLAFAGQLPLYLNVPDLALPPAVKELARGVTDRVAFEALKDLAANELFRSDLFVRKSARPDPRATRRFFEETSFGALTSAEHFKRSVRLPVYTLDFTGPVYGALIPRLCAAPASAADLARSPELAGLGSQRIAQCIQNLCLGGQVVPMRPPRAAPRRDAALRVASARNRAVLAEGIRGVGPLVLAAPATGTGVAVSLLEAIFLRLLTEVPPADREAWLRAIAAERTFPLASGTRRVEDADDLVRIAATELDAFAAGIGPKLVELGILEPVVA
jgi:SAM-dependent methyltransferase